MRARERMRKRTTHECTRLSAEFGSFIEQHRLSGGGCMPRASSRALAIAMLRWTLAAHGNFETADLEAFGRKWDEDTGGGYAA